MIFFLLKSNKIHDSQYRNYQSEKNPTLKISPPPYHSYTLSSSPLALVTGHRAKGRVRVSPIWSFHATKGWLSSWRVKWILAPSSLVSPGFMARVCLSVKTDVNSKGKSPEERAGRPSLIRRCVRQSVGTFLEGFSLPLPDLCGRRSEGNGERGDKRRKRREMEGERWGGWMDRGCIRDVWFIWRITRKVFQLLVNGHDWKPISCHDFGQREERSVDDGATSRGFLSTTAGVICSRVFMWLIYRCVWETRVKGEIEDTDDFTLRSRVRFESCFDRPRICSRANIHIPRNEGKWNRYYQ